MSGHYALSAIAHLSLYSICLRKQQDVKTKLIPRLNKHLTVQVKLFVYTIYACMLSAKPGHILFPSPN